jgi:hypothetical protein
MVGRHNLQWAHRRPHMVRTWIMPGGVNRYLTRGFRQAGSSLSSGTSHDDGYTVYPGEVCVSVTYCTFNG